MKKIHGDRWFATMFEKHASIMLIVDPESGAIVDANYAAANFYGTSRKALSRLTMTDLDGRPSSEVLEMMKRAWREEENTFVFAHRTSAGESRTVVVDSSPIVFGGRSLLLAIVHDHTEHRRLRSALEQCRREMKTLNRLSEIFDSPRPLEELYNEIVDEICAATGFPIAGIGLYDEAARKITIHGRKILPDGNERPIVELPLDSSPSGVVIRSGKPLIEKNLFTNPRYTTTGLAQTPAQVYIGYPMKVGKKIIGCLTVVHADRIEIDKNLTQWIETLANYVAVLTARKREEEELHRSRELLREWSKDTQTAIEDERRRIALELHDELGQQLSLLMLDLGMVETELPRSTPSLREKIRSMMKLTDTAIRSVQRISSELRPQLLDDLGLGAAAAWAVKQFQARTKIKCTVLITPPDLKTDQQRSIVIFRILQEALTNVMRHSKATRVHVRLSGNDSTIALKVSDNGIGISPEKIHDANSIGLMGMRERVRPLNGSVMIVNRGGVRTEVRVSIGAKP